MATPLVTPWSSLFPGIDLATGFAYHAFGVDLPPIRIQRATMARVDLRAPGIGFITSPAAGPYQTLGQVVTGFLGENPAVRLAVNANFSWVENGAFQVGSPYSLFGLAVASGAVVCDPTQKAPSPPPPATEPDVPDTDHAGAIALTITTRNVAAFQVATAQHPPDLTGVWAAIAGSTPPKTGEFPPTKRSSGPLWLVQGGANQVDPNSHANAEVAARTAVGLSADGQSLFLVVVEGREKAPPQYGAGLYDVAEWLLVAGASDGINLDGGGSSVMAAAGPQGPVLLTVPFGDETNPGVQRPVGNFFGVIAQ